MTAPYITRPTPVSRIMLKVLLALLPGIAAYTYAFGPAILIQLALATVVSVGTEAAMLRLRGYAVKPFLADLTAVVTAWILALCLPPGVPWWVTVTAVMFALVVAKHLYGGLGNNLFNPAMVGFAVMIISFPLQMSQWLAPAALAQAHFSFGDTLGLIFGAGLPDGVSFDAIASATPLDTLKTQLKNGAPMSQILGMPIFGQWGGNGTEWVAGGYLLGGLWLLQQRVIRWQVPVAMLSGLALLAGSLHLANPQQFAGPLLHWFSGGAMLGAFFVATDPVTGPTTPRGQLIYGALIGLLTYLIRVFGGFPDGVAFAVLLLNMCTPLIDIYTQPPVFGKKTQGSAP